ncbi:MAG: protein-disulfide reductase DsbD family protein, partial [Rikenellaceae bacterium]|nr:protein-disulfide reductase DsbD family protein [Rikenellaceae bacterium]
MIKKGRFLFLLILFLVPGILKGQIQNPVKWSTDYEHVSGNVYRINFRASISGDWHLYDLGPYENGPNATLFEFEEVTGYRFVSDVVMVIKPVVEYDSMFGVDVGSFKKEAHFARTVEVFQSDSVVVKGYVEWMVCDKGSCLPPTDKEFLIKLPGAPKAVAKPAAKSATESGSKGASAGVTANGSSSGQPVAGGSGKGSNTSSASSDVSGGSAAAGVDSGDSSGSAAGGIADDELAASDGLASGEELASGDAAGFSPGSAGEDKSMWGVIIEAIIWGFVALLTPCVFPMVPMTVSFFLKQSQEGQARELAAGGAGSAQTGESVSRSSSSRSSSARGRIMASFFGLSIIALYTLPIAAIIVITYFAGGEAVTADIFNWLATHWVPNVLFFLIFMVFAASFFGAFEIVLPSWLVNKSDSKSDKGGYAGVFFMALTLVLVSFSCTGPIVGTILIKS